MNAEAGAAGTYTLTITDPFTGCFNQFEVTVEENADAPDLALNVNNELNCNFNSTEINSVSSNNNLSYAWSTSDGNVVQDNGGSITVDQAGTYTLIVTDPDSGCESMEVINVTSNFAEPDVNIVDPNVITCIENTVSLNANSSASLSYTWSTTDGNIVSGNQGASINVNQAGTYIVNVTDNNNGCVNSSQIVVSEDVESPDVLAVGGDESVSYTHLTLPTTPYV